ncbi:methylated-DNA--[protein]-cysteine S-methyltransferase, partial [Chloroflexota bacterium]
MKPRYIIFDTNIGWVGVLASEKGLLRTTLPRSSAQKAWQLSINNVDQANETPLFRDLMERLKAYLSGRKVVFPDELDLSMATPFQCRVWEVTKLIHYGETKSYLWVAEQIGNPRAAQAVGQALA